MSESGTWVGEEVERRFWPKFLGKPGEGGSVPHLDCEMCDLRQGGSGLCARPQSQTPLPDGPPTSLGGGPQFCMHFPAALAAAPLASSGCLPLSLSLPVLQTFFPAAHQTRTLCDLALRPQRSPCAHLPTGSTLQRVVSAYPTPMALLCPGSRGRFLYAMGCSHTFFSAFQLFTPSFSVVGYSSSDEGTL